MICPVCFSEPVTGLYLVVFGEELITSKRMR
jgi:hypothetical protein